MRKEKVFIVVSHKNSLKKDPRTDKCLKGQWEVAESVEFINQVRDRHISTSSAIGDYINRKMITGARYGITEYDKFEEYVRTKYKKQMDELDAAYREIQVQSEESPEVIADQFGNIRAKTVFDVA
jgi:hypothetical protein